MYGSMTIVIYIYVVLIIKHELTISYSSLQKALYALLLTTTVPAGLPETIT